MIYLCIPLGSYLMCFRFLQVMWRYQQSGDVPHQAHGVEYQGQPPVPTVSPLAEPAQ
jgi:TRAP-type C4-dicarboxylate transport system permease small subunit